MKDKNAVLIGFVASAIDYLQNQDNNDISESLEQLGLEDIKGDLTGKLNSLLYNANTDSSYLVNAGREAFSDFVVDRKKTLTEEFADLFNDNANKEKDIVDRLEKILNQNNQDSEPDLSELFPGLLLSGDDEDETKKLFNSVLKEVETENYENDELDNIFSQIIAHENGIDEEADIDDLFDGPSVIEDDLVVDLIEDQVSDFFKTETEEEVHMTSFTVPSVKKNDKSDEAVYQTVCKCSEHIADEVDSEREYYGVPAPVMWVEPSKEIHMSEFSVPAVKKTDKSDFAVYEQVCECSENIAAVVDSERAYYGVSAPVMWTEPVKEEKIPYIFIANPGLDYVNTSETEEKPEDDIRAIEDYLDSYISETEKEETDLDDYLSDLVDELESTITIPEADGIYTQIAELYPYLSQDFIRVVYDLKNVVAAEYPFGRKMILLHRLNFRETDGLRSFAEIMLDHGYQVNVDEEKMIVDTFREHINSDGLMLTTMFEIANQAAFFGGEYEGYRVIPVDPEV